MCPGCPPTPTDLRSGAGCAAERRSAAEEERYWRPTMLSASSARVIRPVREDLRIEQFQRVAEASVDPATCLLAQGFACLGPATRAGCEARCIRGNMPCTGCFGPTSRVRDFGGKAIAGLASAIDSNEEEEIDRILDSIPDPVGTFLPLLAFRASLLERKRLE